MSEYERHVDGKGRIYLPKDFRFFKWKPTVAGTVEAGDRHLDLVSSDDGIPTDSYGRMNLRPQLAEAKIPVGNGKTVIIVSYFLTK